MSNNECEWHIIYEDKETKRMLFIPESSPSFKLMLDNKDKKKVVEPRMF